MQFQKKPWWCGPASVYNALQLIGYRSWHSQSMLAKLMDTTEQYGTDEVGIQDALIKLGVDCAEFGLDDTGEAYRALREQLRFGHPVVLCVQNWQHWVTAVGTLGKYTLLFDPANYPYNVDRRGLVRLTEKGLMKKWRAARRMAGNDPPYYGIIVLGQKVL